MTDDRSEREDKALDAIIALSHTNISDELIPLDDDIDPYINMTDEDIKALEALVDRDIEANARLRLAAHDLLAACRNQAAWIERLLKNTESHAVRDYQGNVIDRFSAAPVPEWDLRQKLQALNEEIAKATGKEP